MRTFNTALAAGALLCAPQLALAQTASSAFISEFHYDNAGSDSGEFVEIGGAAGENLDGWTLVLYNGNGGGAYFTQGFTASDVLTGGVLVVGFPSNGIQNGGPDGIALVNPNGDIEFLSYEGVFTASDGPAAGLVSTDIGVSESSATAVGDSLQCGATGSFAAPAPESRGVSNATAGCVPVIPGTPPPPPVAAAITINEFHYDNAGADVGEFVELAGATGASLENWQLVFYNGNGGASYGTVSFTAADVLTRGFFVVDFAGIQNGSPDGIALISPNGQVAEFISYEGSFTAADGPAAGVASTDVGVSEPSNTPIGDSLQRFRGAFRVGTETRGRSNVRVNEFHYDNAGTDTGEFVEIAGPAGGSLEGFSLVLYNGSNGQPYSTTTFGAADILAADPAGASRDGFVVVNFPSNGIQNGAPDAIALIDDAGAVVEFLSYEGIVAASAGPASGLTSTDIGASESSSTPVGSSLQLLASGWSALPQTPNATNQAAVAVARTIMEIQGAGHTSPESGNLVETTGVVTQTGIFDAIGASDEQGFYLQDPTGDGNLATSDAVFVVSSEAVVVGDAVTVQGTVTETGFPTELTYTRIQSTSVSVTSSGNPLPAPIVLGAGGRVLPTENINDDAFASFDPATDGVDFFESLEGMRVRVPNPLAITGTSRFNEIFVVTDGGVGATGLSARKTLNISPDDFNPEKIQIDTGRETFDPMFVPLPDVDTGATFADIVGTVGYDFGNFQVQPDTVSVLTPASILPQVSNLTGDAGSLLVASYNVLNLETNDADGDTDVANGRFDAIADQILNSLQAPDVVGLQEVQDNSGSVDDGVTAADLTLQALVDAIVAAGGPTYAFIDNTFIGNNTSGGQPGGNIRTAFLYNPDRVSLVPGSVQTVANLAAFAGARLPLIASFEFEGEEVTVVVNHFSSKGGSSAIFGTNQPFEARQEDLVVNGSLDERLAQSAEVRNFIDSFQTANPQGNLVVLGDLNEFEFVSPVSVNLAGALENLTLRLPEDERYTFVFQGNSQSLDHILVSQGLGAIATFEAVHVNAEFAETAGRASDHDPLVVRFEFTPPAPTCAGRTATIYVDGHGVVVGGPQNGQRYRGFLFGTLGSDVIVGTNRSDFISGFTGSDVICGLRGRDTLVGGFGNDLLFGDQGRDTLLGGFGHDLLDGGTGRDRCVGGFGRDRKVSCER